MGKGTYIVLIWTALVGILLAQTAAAVTLTVEDAGSDGACTNAWPPSIVGNYAENGTLNGAPRYDSPGGWYIYRVNIWGSNNWVVSNTLGSADYNNSTIAFYQVSSAATPPLGSSYTKTNSACGKINLVSGGTATPPPAPTIYNLNSGMLPYISGGSTTVAWSAVTGAIGYKLDVATNSSFTTFVAGYNGLVVTASPTPPTSSTVSGLTGPGTTYYFRVRAYNSVGDSANSATLSTTAVSAAPTATAASGISGSAFQANWNAQTGAASYKLYVCTDSGFTTCLAGFNPASVSGTSASVSGLSPGTNYYYRLKASNENGDSGVSNTISLATNALPTLGGTFTTAGAVNDNSTIAPFSGVTVADANGNNVSVTITYAAANGTLTGTGLSGTAGNYLLAAGAPATTTANLQGLVFHPTLHQSVPGATVVTTFTLRPSDGIDNGAANSSTVVTTTMVNTAPAFAGATTTLTVDRNSGATDVKGLLHVSDTDSGQTLTWTQQTAPAHGTLTVSGATAGSGGTDIAPGGTITYQPTADYYGSDSFTVQVSDGMDTTTRTIAVTVNWSAEVLSIDRAAASPTNAASVDWSVSFNDSVTGIAAANFSLTNPGGGLSGYSITGFSGSGSTWTVTVNPGTGTGTLQLDMVDGTGITPPLTNLAFAGQQYVVDTVAPTITDGNISISGATGTGGAFKIGDTVTAIWNNTAGGDNNSDTISSVTVDFSQFGGGAAVAATNAAGTWTASYTIVAGAVDAGNRNVAVTATDDAGNPATRADTSNATVDNVAPTVTNANISISGASGTGGAYKIGDTVTAIWNNTAGGDNNSDTIAGVTVDFSAFGGGAAVAASNAAGTWTATYTIVAGVIDGTNKNVDVTATDNAGNATTAADTTNATLDNHAPTVTDARISISGASGTGGAYKIGDTVTATWNNTAGGDNNSDTIAGVTVDFSAFGGGAAVAAFNAGGTWTATYTIVAGAVDGSNKNVSVTATDNAGNTAITADTTNATVDNVAPTVSNGNISISGATGTGGVFKIGDTVTATWNNTAGGDNNSDTISGVTVDFSAFGGGAAVAASNAAGTWTATYTIVAGAIDGTNRNVSVTATDNAGNATTTADTTNATLDNQAPTVSNANISISGASGTGGAYRIGDTVTATWDNTAGGDNNGDTISSVTMDFSAFGGAAVAAFNAAGTWTATYTIGGGAIDGTNRNVSVTATDNAGNATTTADTTNATVDNQAPTVTDGNINISGATGTGGAFKIGDTVTAIWNNTPGGDNNGDTISSVTVDFSQFGGGAAVAAANAVGTWTAASTITSGAIDADNRNILVTATDNVGNATTTADTSNATVDSQAPVVTDANIGISGATGTGGAYKIGDTVTMSWNSSAGGDNNSDTISSVTVDFSQFGGGAAIAAANAGGTWTAASTITSGAIDASNRNVAVTATDNAGNTATAADTSNATVDSQAPAVTDGNISISGATGTGGAFKVGDTVTMSWDNTAAGDNNDDISAVTVDFSQFGGGAAVAAINTADTWSAAYTITEDGGGSIDATNRNVSVTAVDNAGNSTTTADSTNATVDNDSPAVPSTPDMAVLSDTGSSSTDNITNNTSPTFDGTSDANTDLTLHSSLDGAVGTATSGAGGAWSVTSSLLTEGTHNITATAADPSGNTSTSPALVVVIDITDPVLNGMPANILANTDPGQATAVVSWTEPTVTDNVDGSLLPTVLSAPTAGLGNGSAFPLGTTTMTFQATDSAGNSSSAASFSVTVVDNEPPVFSGVPADITVSTLSSSSDTAIVTWTAPTAADNVDGAVIPLQTAGPPSGSEFPVGTTTIVYTATDTQGNISTASFTVAVKQAKFPWEILLPALVSPNKVSGAGAAP